MAASLTAAVDGYAPLLMHTQRQKIRALAQTLQSPRNDALLRAGRPILKAYVYALVASTGFEGVRMLGVAVTRRKDLGWVKDKASRILHDAFRLDSFSSLAPMVVAASTIVPLLTTHALDSAPPAASLLLQRFLTLGQAVTAAEFAAVFLVCLVAFRLMNRPADKAVQSAEAVVNYTQPVPPLSDASVDTPSYLNTPALEAPPGSAANAHSFWDFPAGRTLFITSFAAVNAAAVVGNYSVARLRQSSLLSSSPAMSSTAAALVPQKGTAMAVTFAVSCAVIMWTWVYYPERLPKEYNRWIAQGANMDPRILESLRGVRSGKLQYYVDTGYESLRSFAVDLGYPADLGDHTKTCPMPCVLIHSGKGPNCEWNAICRFIEAASFGARIYLPLNLGMLVRKPLTRRAVNNALVSSARSVAFLGTFAAAFHYTTCLVRQKLGPSIVGTSVERRTLIDSTLCVPLASMACGWSILIEQPMRREEMALFVAPRALRALLPESYAAKFQWREQWAFALSVAVALSAAKQNPSLVPGVWGRMLRNIYS